METKFIWINNRLVGLEEIKLRANASGIADWEKQVYLFILNWFDDSDYIEQKTSGSTGTPKHILLKKSAMTVSALKTLNFFGLKQNQTAWLCLPIDYIAGKMMVVRALLGQLNLLITKPAGCPQNPDQSVEFVAMVPLQVKNRIERGVDFRPLRKLIIGGAAVDFNLIKVLHSFPTEVYATYGMTETCSHIALQRLNGHSPDPFFRTLPGIKISINRDSCLVLDAQGLLEHPIETTDRVELLSESTFRWLGRNDFVINSGGIKISPESLEREIAPIIGRECLIVPGDDEKLGQKIILAIEKNEQDGPFDQEELMIRLKKTISPHLVPKTILQIDHFERNENLKIDRMRTAQQVLSLLSKE